MASFAAGHRILYQDDLQKMDVQFRKLLRQVIGPPHQTDWNKPFHEILHEWHAKINTIRSEAGLMSFAEATFKQYWDFAHYVACFPPERWGLFTMLTERVQISRTSMLR